MLPHPFVQKVAQTIKRHRMAMPGNRILIGVSGGADSVCLARTLHLLDCDIAIAHLNHGLRGKASDTDEAFVKELARRLDIPFFRRQLSSNDLRGNLEAAARTARRAFFQDLMTARGFDRVALAHSRDDRVETFLLHLVRGSGAQGLVSMQPVSDWLIRPLIDVTRLEIETFLRELGQGWRRDATNEDLRFTRNRIRRDLIPRLIADFNPRFTETLSRTTEILTDENDWMNREARAWLDRAFDSGQSGSNSEMFSFGEAVPYLRISGLDQQPVALVRRVLRMALARAGSDLRDVGFEHLEQVRRLLDPGKSGRRIELPGSLEVERSFDVLVFRSGRTPSVAYEYELAIPGRIGVPEAGCRFEARVIERAIPPLPDSGARVCVDGESLGPCVKIRNWKNGDTYEPVGIGKSKLKRLFQTRHIPRDARSRWPVLVAGTSIVWVASFPVAHEFAPTTESKRIIELEAVPAGPAPPPAG